MAATAAPTNRFTRLSLRLWVACLLLGIAALVVHDVGRIGWSGSGTFFDRWVYDGVEFAAGIGCLARAAFVKLERRSALAFGIALVMTTVGDVLYDFVYGGSPPFPSAADVFYLAFYPCCYIGLGLLLRARISRFSASLWLDGLTAGLAAAALGSSLILHVVLAGTNGSELVVLTNMGYPLGDIVLLAMVVFVFTVNNWRPGRAWSLLAAALILNVVGDGIYLYQSAIGTYVEGTWLDAMWPTSLVLIAFSTLQAPVRRGKRGQLEQRSLLGTPVVCGLIAVGVLVAAESTNVHPLAVALAAATVVAVLARTALTFRENAALLAQSQDESLTDSLTGLGNRRRLVSDLEKLVADPPADARVLAIFDLNGFKNYNDSFGHPAGDALLERLAHKLAVSVEPAGTAYRMGGDEFCALLPASDTVLQRAARALHEQGESFAISTSYGAVTIPDEAREVTSALSVADARLYAHKEQQTSRRGTAHELLLRTLAEREPGLREHVAGVAQLAVAVGRRLGLTGSELDELRLAAELHDVGKLAIPDAVLQKPEPLDDYEWRFIQQHTLIGQRILSGVASLVGVGQIVRSTHENWDGSGYPDGLSGEQIPLAARIINASDAYTTMTSDRPYRAARSEDEAIAELRKCSGTQFDPALVTAISHVLAAQEIPAAIPA